MKKIFLCCIMVLMLCVDVLAFTTAPKDDDACEAAWLFTEGSGTSVADSSANSNTGTFASSGHPAWNTTDVSFGVSGTAPNSVDFTPSDFIAVGTTLRFNRDFTIIALVYLDTVSGNHGIISGDISNYYFRISGDVINILDSCTADIDTSETSLSADQWYSVAVTIDSDGDITFYLNGEEDGTGTTSANLDNGATHNITIGADYNNAQYTEAFDGKIAEMGMFSRTLTPTEIKQIYDYGLAADKSGGNESTQGLLPLW